MSARMAETNAKVLDRIKKLLHKGESRVVQMFQDELQEMEAKPMELKVKTMAELAKRTLAVLQNIEEACKELDKKRVGLGAKKQEEKKRAGMRRTVQKRDIRSSSSSSCSEESEDEREEARPKMESSNVGKAQKKMPGKARNFARDVKIKTATKDSSEESSPSSSESEEDDAEKAQQSRSTQRGQEDSCVSSTKTTASKEKGKNNLGKLGMTSTSVEAKKNIKPGKSKACAEQVCMASKKPPAVQVTIANKDEANIASKKTQLAAVKSSPTEAIMASKNKTFVEEGSMRETKAQLGKDKTFGAYGSMRGIKSKTDAKQLTSESSSESELEADPENKNGRVQEVFKQYKTRMSMTDLREDFAGGLGKRPGGFAVVEGEEASKRQKLAEDCQASTAVGTPESTPEKALREHLQEFKTRRCIKLQDSKAALLFATHVQTARKTAVDIMQVRMCDGGGYAESYAAVGVAASDVRLGKTCDGGGYAESYAAVGLAASDVRLAKNETPPRTVSAVELMGSEVPVGLFCTPPRPERTIFSSLSPEQKERANLLLQSPQMLPGSPFRRSYPPVSPDKAEAAADKARIESELNALYVSPR